MIWEKGYCILRAMPYAVQVDKEIMENVLHKIDPKEAYNEL